MAENPYNQEDQVPDDHQEEPKPDPVGEAIKAAKLAAEAAERNSAAMAQMVRQQQRQQDLWSQGNPYAQQAPPPQEEPDPEIDPDIQKVIDKRLEKAFGQIEHAYIQDRQGDMKRFAAMEYERAAGRLPGFKEVADDVREYLNRAPLHLQAAPGAVDEAYYAVMGRRYANEVQRSSERPPQVNDSSRSAPQAPQIGAEEASFMRRIGVEMTREELAVLSSRDVNSDQWFETVSKKGGKNV